MSAPWKYPEELRERAKRMVAEAWEQDGSLSLHAAVNRIGPRVGVQPDTLRTWCRQADVDAGKRAGVTTADAAKIKELEREVKRSVAGCWPASRGGRRSTPRAGL